MVIQELQGWGSFIASGIAIVVAIYGALTAKSTKNADRIDDVEAKLNTHIKEGSESRAAIASRLTEIEGNLRHMPDAQSAKRTEVALSEVRGELQVLSERLKPVAAISERLQEFLLEEAKDRRSRS